MSQWLSDKRLALIGPTERLGHRLVEILDKSQHFLLEISDRGKSATLEQLTRQNAEPNLNLIHPGSMFRRIVKHNAMSWIREKNSPALQRSQNARLAFDTEADVQIGFIGHIAHKRFRLMRVEIVYNEMPLHDLRIGFDGALDMREKVRLLTSGASRH